MLERFDIDLNDETDELLDSIDDMIFDDDDDDLDDLELSPEVAAGTETVNLEEDDDTISEEDLEKLLIGIDEENGILDIPDEEEVLEELKFVDELPRATSKPKESKSKPNKKPKKEKKEKEPIKLNLPKIEFGEIKEKVMKYKFHIAAVFVSFLILTGVSIKLMSGKNKKVESEVFQEETATAGVELSDEVISENLSTEEQLAVYRGKLKTGDLPEEKREEVEIKVKEIEEEIREEKREEIKNYVKELKSEYTDELETVKPTVFKIHDQNLIIGLVIKNNEEAKMYDEVYNAIVTAFEKNENVKTVNINVFAVEDQLRKKVEINAARYEFERVKEMDVEAKDKLLAFEMVKR